MRNDGKHTWILGLCAAGACAFGIAAAQGQHMPSARGSLDAITVVPGATQPAAPADHTGMDAAMIPGHPGKTQAPKTGALRMHMVQATKDAPALGHDPVRVELMAKGVVLKTILTKLDDKGMIELHDLPLEPAFQPIITVIHNGVEEQMIGAPMHRYQPAIEMEMKVYEITADKPAWTIGIRDIGASAVEENGQTVLRITEMIGGYNPADRAWTGETVNGRTQTVAIPLTAGAQHVLFGPGMGEAKAEVIDNVLVRGKTMLPASSQYVFAYDVPVKDGKVSLSFTAPAPTTLFALYLPGDVKIESKEGLEAGTVGGAEGAQGRKLLKARRVEAGKTVSVVLSGVKVPPPVETKPAEVVEQKSELNLPVPQEKKMERP